MAWITIDSETDVSGRLLRRVAGLGTDTLRHGDIFLVLKFRFPLWPLEFCLSLLTPTGSVITRDWMPSNWEIWEGE